MMTGSVGVAVGGEVGVAVGDGAGVGVVVAVGGTVGVAAAVGDGEGVVSMSSGGGPEPGGGGSYAGISGKSLAAAVNENALCVLMNSTKTGPRSKTISSPAAL